jgi:protein-S-isoprenylcysteine O-methyltransferase Ste14
MYGEHDTSQKQKLTLAALHLFNIFLVWWIMFGSGLTFFANMFGFPLEIGNTGRRYFILFGAVLYFIKELFTEFVFLERKVRWSEALTMALWLFIVYVTYSFTGGTNPKPPGMYEYAGAVIYAAGALINVSSELFRYRWRKQAGHYDKLYRDGLFKYSRHINYLGDLLLLTGFSMFTGSVWPFVFPAAMFVLFVVVNIPMLDRHLHDRFGAEFDEYAKHTKRLIPFVY